jgi:hypothetical protein
MVNVTAYGKYVTKGGFTKEFERTFDSLDDARKFFEENNGYDKYAIGEIVRSSNAKTLGEVKYGKYELVSVSTNKVVMTVTTIAYHPISGNSDYGRPIKFDGKLDGAFYLRKVKTVPIMKRELTL